MKTLFLRQLRLLAPSALAVVALGLLTLLAALSLPGADLSRALGFDSSVLAFLVVAFVAPWLLGVAAIAPDAESGALAFLGTLPVGRRRHLLLRALAAAAWTVGVVAPFALGALSSMGWTGNRLELVTLPLLTMLPLGAAGLAAAAATGRSLAGFVVAPLFLLVPGWGYAGFAGWLSAPSGFFVGATLGLPVALVVAAWIGFRDLRHPGTRHLARVVSALGIAVALGCGVTTTAYGWARLVPGASVEARWLTDQGPVALALTSDSGWPSQAEWEPWSLVRRELLVEGAELRDLVARGLPLEPADHPLAVSADGERALVQRGLQVVAVDRGGEMATWPERPAWLAPTSLTVSRRLPAWQRVAAGWTAEGAPWVLQGGEPLGPDGRSAWTLPAGARLESLADGEAVLHGPGGWSLLALRAGAVPTPLELPADATAVELSSSGAWLLVARGRNRKAVERVEARPTAGGAAHEAPYGLNVRYAFSPDESTLIAIRHRGGWSDSTVVMEWLDLRTGRRASVEVKEPGSSWPLVRAWSPSGRRLLTDLGWLDLDDPGAGLRPLALSPGSICHLPDEESAVLATAEGRLVRVPLTR